MTQIESPQYDHIILVGLGGPSSSGKTTAAKALHELITNSILVHLDDFYFPDDQIPIDQETNEQNWDVPEAINFDKFIKYIQGVKLGENLNEKIDTLEADTNTKLTGEEKQELEQTIQKSHKVLENTLIVLVDGFMIYHDPKIVSLFDIKLFYHAPFEILKLRRESRSGYNTVAGFWVDPPNYFENIVWPAYEKNHRKLFANENVNSHLNDYGKNELGLLDFVNGNSTKLIDLVKWSLDSILDNVSI